MPNSVYAASTELTYAVKRAVENDPHSKTTHGGDGCFAAMLFGVTSQQARSDSTFFSTVVAGRIVGGSRKISTLISRASGTHELRERAVAFDLRGGGLPLGAAGQ